MIPLSVACILGGCLDFPIITNPRTIPQLVRDEIKRQNPPKTKNPSCYVMGQFYKECPEVDYD